jgi:hypothetical protein
VSQPGVTKLISKVTTEAAAKIARLLNKLASGSYNSNAQKNIFISKTMHARGKLYLMYSFNQLIVEQC